MELTIKGGLVDGKIKDIGIEDGRITQIGGKIGKQGRVIDAQDCAVLHGFENAHTHTGMSLLRGYADDMQLGEWLQTKIWPMEAKLKDKDIELAAELSALEMIKSGTTKFHDMYFHMDSVLKATQKAGIRGVLAYGMVDLDNAEKREKELKEEERFVKHVEKIGDEKIKAAVGPHGPHTCSGELLEKTKALAEKYGLEVHTHAAETRDEVYGLEKKTGKRPIQLLKEKGLLGPKTILAHCVWVTKEEIRTIAASGARVAHCPASNMKLASGGIAPVTEMLEAGVKVLLGTDGAASNNSLDLIAEMKIAALIHKNARWDARLLPARQALDMITGWTKVEVGAEADLAIVDLKKPHLAPRHNIESNIVYSGKGSDVRTVICGGQVLMDRYKAETLNEEKIIEKANDWAA